MGNCATPTPNMTDSNMDSIPNIGMMGGRFQIQHNQDKMKNLESQLKSGMFLEAFIYTNVPLKNQHYQLSYKIDYGRQDFKWVEDIGTEKYKS